MMPQCELNREKEEEITSKYYSREFIMSHPFTLEPTYKGVTAEELRQSNYPDSRLERVIIDGIRDNKRDLYELRICNNRFRFLSNISISLSRRENIAEAKETLTELAYAINKRVKWDFRMFSEDLDKPAILILPRRPHETNPDDPTTSIKYPHLYTSITSS